MWAEALHTFSRGLLLLLTPLLLLVPGDTHSAPWRLPVDQTFLGGKVILDTLLCQQAGRPNAVRKLAYVSGTDSLEIVKGWISIAPATAIATGTVIKLNFYNNASASSFLHESDTDDSAFLTLGNTGATIPIVTYPIPETYSGWHTISISNGDDGDVRITYYLIVY